MQNVITTAFETVTTVSQGVELLDAFQHLSAREVTLPPLKLCHGRKGNSECIPYVMEKKRKCIQMCYL